MPKVSEMNAGERKELMTKIADQLKANGLEDAKLSFVRETVCPIAAKTVQDSMTISVDGKFDFDKQDAVNAFNTWAKSQDVEGLEFELGCQLKQGGQF